MDKLYIDTLTDAQIFEIEERLRPMRSSYSGFLGPNESLKTVVREDAKTLQRLGITHEQIANKLEYLVQNSPGDDRVSIQVHRTKGIQEDPFQNSRTPGTYANLDIFIKNKRTNEEIYLGGPNIGLIRNYQFFEGKEVKYRLDPETAIRVLELKPE
jgi:hypothetical protein